MIFERQDKCFHSNEYFFDTYISTVKNKRFISEIYNLNYINDDIINKIKKEMNLILL
jgi:hypothetical protein